MHGQKWARNPLGRKGEKSRDLATFILGAAVCRDVPAEVYGTLSQRLAITGLLVFKGLLHQNMMSPMSPLPTAAIYHKDKIHKIQNTQWCPCRWAHIHVYVPPMWAAPDKEKTGLKAKHQNTQGEKKEKGSFPPTAPETLLPCRPQREGSAYAERRVVRKALKAPVYLSCF